MKTKEQILKWLDEQPWANEFHRAVFMLRTDLNLSYNESFISKAFMWDKTEQGEDAWITRDTDFREWYDSNDKPMSWEEYCEQNPIKEDEYYIGNSSSSCRCTTMPKDLCEAFLAYMKLIQLRNAWVKDCDKTACCFKIKSQKDGITDRACPYFENGLSFPTRVMAGEFMDTFKDLLEVAKPLL